MNIAVIGSRTFTDYDYLQEKIMEVLHEQSGAFIDATIVSGGAKGADSLAKQFAKKFSLEYKEYPADWDNIDHPDAVVKTNKFGKKYDAVAGHRRNTQIIEAADIVVAFHNGSKGTADSLCKAKKAGKIIYEYKF